MFIAYNYCVSKCATDDCCLIITQIISGLVLLLYVLLI